MNQKISACIITLNEEDNIKTCLSSLNFVDEIILVDSGSTDQTLKIAEEFTKVKIFYRKFDNYINQKNFCIEQTSHEWILSLDADEEVSENLKSEIQNLNLDESMDGYFIPRLTYYLGKWIYHSGWYPNFQLRFFKKSKGKFAGILVHETVQISGQVHHLKNPLHHYSYKNISDHLKFIDRYSDLCADEKFKKGKNSGVFIAIIKSVWKFIFMYFIKFGFLDGKVGLIISILGSYYNFLKYIKIYELGLNKKKEKKIIKQTEVEILNSK